MRKISIRNIGPIKEADIHLAKVNVIVGPQSSGKSCVLKIACYCTWVEKRIELSQSADIFYEDGYFIQELSRFHKLKGYFKDDTYIGFESDHMKFSYNAADKTFQFEWKSCRWEYKRPKVTYIPAERNMVAAIPNWFDIKLYDDNIRSFMASWDRARKSNSEQLDILNLGVSYQYDAQTNKDRVEVSDNTTLELTNTSSGLQSLIPLFVHLKYISNISHQPQQQKSYSSVHADEELLLKLYEELFKNKGRTEPQHHGSTTDEEGRKTIKASFSLSIIDPYSLLFRSKQDAEECEKIYERYVRTDHAEIFLEEPENNLFPPTQSRLVNWLLEMTEGEHGANLFIATHSPYIITTLLERKLSDFHLFLEKKEGKLSTVITATTCEIDEIYADGIDVFYNIESYI